MYHILSSSQDINVTWNYTSYPDLTDCFKFTLVRWAPLAWLALALLVGLPFLLTSHRPPHLIGTPPSVLLILKLLLAAAFGGLAVADLVYSVMVDTWFVKASLVMILSPAFEIAAMVCSVH